jgi:hypothetical protein
MGQAGSLQIGLKSCKGGLHPFRQLGTGCYVSMARVAQLEWVLDDGYLDMRISSEL